jgi:hypothetical protein
MRCCIKALIRPSATFSLKGEGKALPSPLGERVPVGRVRVMILVLIFLQASSIVLSCPFCKEALPTGMAKGFYWSILLMLAVPMIVVGTIAGAVWRAGKKRHGLRDAHHE